MTTDNQLNQSDCITIRKYRLKMILKVRKYRLKNDLKSSGILRFAQDFGAAQTPRRRLNLVGAEERTNAETLIEILRFAQDFGARLRRRAGASTC